MSRHSWILRNAWAILSLCLLYPTSALAQADAKSLTMQRPTMTAVLVDAQSMAAKKSAKVKVELVAFQLVDPETVNEKPAPGQGHLHYRVDQGPTVASPSPKFSVHDLSSGPHKIKVTLVGNDHMPVGPETVLDLQVP